MGESVSERASERISESGSQLVNQPLDSVLVNILLPYRTCRQVFIPYTPLLTGHNIEPINVSGTDQHSLLHARHPSKLLKCVF